MAKLKPVIPVRPAWLRALWLAALPLAGVSALAAESEPLRFRHLTIADGLSQNAVSAILQDRRGFMWLGTKDGLNRYDGYEFLVFRHDPLDAGSISNSDITALYEDGRGRLWVGTRDGGLNRYERERKRFVRYPAGPERPITSIAGDETGLWLGTDGGGLYRYAFDAAAFFRLRHDPGDPTSLPDDRVQTVLVDRRSDVWIGTETGLARLERSGGAPGGGRDGVAFVRYAGDPGAPLGTIDSTITALYEDGRGRLWVGSVPGLSVFDPGRQRVTHHYHRYREYRRGWGRAKQILVDRAGTVWLSTHSELMRLDPETGEFQYDPHDPDDPTGINSDQPTALYQDRSGVIWVGTNGYGINIHDPKATRFRTVRRPPGRAYREAGFPVYALFEDSERRVWIGAGVLYRWDRVTGEFISFETTPDRPDDFGNTGVWSMLEDPPGYLWAGTYRGLYHYRIETGTYRHYPAEPDLPAGLPEAGVKKVFRARDGTLWLVTENYLSRLLDPVAGRFLSYRYTEVPVPGRWTFPTLHEDSAGRLWLGSNHGLTRFDPATGAFRRYVSDPLDPGSLSHDIVRSMLPDPAEPHRYLWIGTAGGGLNRFDMAEERFIRYTAADGLPNNVIYGILADDDGHLWLSTNRGLARFDPRTGAVRTFDARDGLQSDEFNSGAYFRSPSGELYFGGLYGFNYFDPEEVRDNPHVPEVVITGFKRGNRSETVRDSGTVLPVAISEAETIRLRARDRVVSFEFAALEFSAPASNRYAYRLVGFNDEWVESGTVRTATYTNLPPGSYTFQVRATNNDGVWNEDGTSLALVVVPPWWQTRWATALWVLLVIGLLWAVRHYELSRVDLRRRLELEQLEAEKLRELERMRSRFFANISHEFRTPLTLTLGPLEDLLEGRHGPIDDDGRDQIDLARRNASRVLDLINQILELARLEGGRTVVRACDVELGPYVRAVATLFEALARRRSIDLDVVAPPEPVSVYADPEHLEKVVWNLLSNALKFTPEGGTVRVTIRADAREARIEVRDSGPGIPEAERARIFDRFHRAESVTESGTGIGLALARELVELHGGRLDVESEEGFGSTFTVTLLRGTAHLTPDQIVEDRAVPFPRTAPPLSVPATAGNGDGPDPSGTVDDVTTILVVEDNEEVLDYLRRHLGGAYRVLEARDGDRALAMVQSELPDLVLSDIVMPGMNGLDLCAAIKASPETDFIPVVLLSALAAPGDRLTGLEVEADDYLTKPFHPAEVRARVANLIASRKRLRQRFASAPLSLSAGPVEVESADQAFLEEVRAAIEENLSDEDYTVERLAKDVAHSRGHLHRRLKDLLDEPPSDVIRRLRLERAAQLLEAEAGTVSAIAYSVGFKSVSHFSNRFQDHFGVRPSAYATRER